ncbi:gephyrin-like molybdotransferase Glp [uncultured Flavobacterium sp.]|uniref:molybdopterin molybdotransferase MoeA n=1 Tax=uncultured Flavobacterium sp. TaxID=165435 RepID=UPI0025ED88A7|nr:gephyrin-like molybdotransferase Glp [uncultured Flavobacterium sp.]
MISVNEAKTIIQSQTKSLAPIRLPLLEAFGYTLAEDIFAIIDIPFYPQSSMDGYAFAFKNKDNPLEIIGEMPAGTSKHITIKANQATRIFTGGPLPINADTVVMQEKANVTDNILLIDDDQIQLGDNVRNKGAEVQKDSLAMAKNTYLSVAAIGFLAGIGITEIAVFPPPKITIILTGNELQDPGNPLEFGQVYEANSYMLTTALQQAGIKNIAILKSEDNLETLKDTLKKAIDSSDIILLTGGVSVGDYDFVASASELCGVKKHFHKIKQRPGKPLFFGTKDTKIVFGLPGNPSSALVCFYQYVLPMLEEIMHKSGSIKTVEVKLTDKYPKKTGLTHFLKGNFLDGEATPLNAQQSFRLSSFAQANCLIELEENKSDYHEGDIVKVYLLN